MKKIFFTPGPSQLYPTVAGHIQVALRNDILSISHRSERFQKIFRGAKEGLRTLLRIPKEYHIVFVSSGTEAMERIIENTVFEKSFHFVNGSFSKRWYKIAKELGKKPILREVSFGKGFEVIPHIPDDTELICFTHNETSSGVAINPELMYAIGEQNPHALIAVDIVSSVPYVDLDYKKVDCVFFSVQKLFGLPAGLGIVILSPKAVAKARKLDKEGKNIGTYHNFPTLIEWGIIDQTLETPNVLGIYLLNSVMKDFLQIGIEKIRKETEEKAKIIYAFLDNHQVHRAFVAEKDRSQTVIVAHVVSAKHVLGKLKIKGLIVGAGYGPMKENQIRIANFPAVTISDVERLLQNL